VVAETGLTLGVDRLASSTIGVVGQPGRHVACRALLSLADSSPATANTAIQ
jgi:hypothetical protein